MALKHYDFELRSSLLNDVKVDENFCPHSTHISKYLYISKYIYI